VSWLASGQARRFAVALLAALAISFVATLASGEGADTAAGRLGGDYPAFYAAGRIAADGDLDEVNDLARLEREQADFFPADEDEGFLTWAYPPHVALLYRPLAALPYRPSYAVHTALMVVAFVAAVRLLRPLVPWIAGASLPAIALGLAAWPMFRGIGAGQNTALTLLLLVGAWRASAASRDGLAGVLLGLLLFKPQLAVLAVALWAVTRRWRAVLAFAAVAAATWALTAAFAGAGWVSRWVEDVRAYDSTEDVNAHNHVSLPEAAHAAFELSAVGWALAVAVGAATAWRWFRTRQVDLALAVPAILLCAAHAVFYDVGLTVLTAAVLLPIAPAATAALYAAQFAEPLKEPLGWNPLVLVLLGWWAVNWQRSASSTTRSAASVRPAAS
jgi:alpha-1,2-mannosyltransferase